MPEFLMRPKIDFAFKEVMMDEKARTGFLAAVLGLDPLDIKEARILNPYLRKVHDDDKLGILDVRVLLNNDTEIDTEIQLSTMASWADRSLFYVSKMYVDQIGESEDYNHFKKCVNISILDFTLFKGDAHFYSRFHIWEDTRHIKYTDKMEFHVIELPKLPKGREEENNDVFLWAKFINAETEEEFEMVAARNKYIESAYEHLRVISQDEGKRLEYEARKKAIRDYNQGIWEAKEEGRKEGKEEGRKEGRKDSLKEVAKSLLTMGQSPEFIMQATGLPLGQIEELRKGP